ncbi:hypothetical protein HUJ05_008758 [Dendroctonus ponderosae]|nr:hypothetical protein HUJ05_008758 [Dendroctonus ponderosae]
MSGDRNLSSQDDSAPKLANPATEVADNSDLSNMSPVLSNMKEEVPPEKQSVPKPANGKICPECGKSYRSNYKLAEHMTMHTGEKKHKCQMCEKRFRSKMGLAQHEAKHTAAYSHGNPQGHRVPVCPTCVGRLAQFLKDFPMSASCSSRGYNCPASHSLWIYMDPVDCRSKKKGLCACILPESTYALETVTLTQEMAERLRTAQRAMKRSLLGIGLRDKIRNTEIRRRTKVKDIIEHVNGDGLDMRQGRTPISGQYA